MLNSFMPHDLSSLISQSVNLEKLNEIRIRLNQPILLNIYNKIYSINKEGLCQINKGIYATKELIEKIIYIASENSVYASMNQISSGYITAKNGIRIGVGGECVYKDGQVSNIKNISSLNIRIPHEISGCSNKIMPFILEDDRFVNNTLILSPPGVGKTTILRDMVKQISFSKNYFNCLVVDERMEIAGKNEIASAFNLGYNVDVLFGCDKSYGFMCGIRSMAPNIIFTDEIATKSDIEGIIYASSCGVNIIATMHALNLQDFLNKSDISEIFKNSIFSRYVVLSKRKGLGTIEGVYDQNFRMIYRE